MAKSFYETRRFIVCIFNDDNSSAPLSFDTASLPMPTHLLIDLSEKLRSYFLKYIFYKMSSMFLLSHLPLHDIPICLFESISIKPKYHNIYIILSNEMERDRTRRFYKFSYQIQEIRFGNRIRNVLHKLVIWLLCLHLIWVAILTSTHLLVINNFNLV